MTKTSKAKVSFARDLNSLGRIVELAALLALEIESADENDFDDVDKAALAPLETAVFAYTNYYAEAE